MAVSNDIRAQVQAQMPEQRVRAQFTTFPSAWREIQDAAYNRRMIVREYVGRAALAFAVYDSQGEVRWEDITEDEPTISNIVLGGYQKSRLRGRGHGQWQIVRLR